MVCALYGPGGFGFYCAETSGNDFRVYDDPLKGLSLVPQEQVQYLNDTCHDRCSCYPRDDGDWMTSTQGFDGSHTYVYIDEAISSGEEWNNWLDENIDEGSHESSDPGEDWGFGSLELQSWINIPSKERNYYCAPSLYGQPIASDCEVALEQLLSTVQREDMSKLMEWGLPGTVRKYPKYPYAELPVFHTYGIL